MRVLRTALLDIPRLRLALVCLGLCACASGESATPADPSSQTRVDLRLERVELTQAVQEDDGSVPMLAGTAVAVNVVIVRNSESVVEVPVVLRLFRGSTLLFVDTTRTGGVLGPLSPATATSAQFLIPANLVAPGISWQVELDPARTLPDSSRGDNILPRELPRELNTVVAPPIRLRLVPVILAEHGGAIGDVSPANAEQYVRLARQIFPLGVTTVSVGPPVTSNANFGPPSEPAGDLTFWSRVLGDVDAARTKADAADEYWYGVVSLPDGYARIVYAGFGYIPTSPGNLGSGSRTAAGFGISRGYTMDIAAQLLAHELGHNFGRKHSPGCDAGAPLDSSYPGLRGTISTTGTDVWSWSNGLTRGAPTIGRETGDVMSYCSPKWISPYTYSSVLRWRLVPPLLGRIGRRPEGIAVP